MSVSSVIDLPTFEALKESMGADFINELVQAYFEEAPQLLAKLQQALARQDCELFRQAAHSIKSTSNSFGALAVGRAGEGTGNDGTGSQSGRRSRQSGAVGEGLCRRENEAGGVVP